MKRYIFEFGDIKQLVVAMDHLILAIWGHVGNHDLYIAYDDKYRECARTPMYRQCWGCLKDTSLETFIQVADVMTDALGPIDSVLGRCYESFVKPSNLYLPLMSADAQLQVNKMVKMVELTHQMISLYMSGRGASDASSDSTIQHVCKRTKCGMESFISSCEPKHADRFSKIFRRKHFIGTTGPIISPFPDNGDVYYVIEEESGIRKVRIVAKDSVIFNWEVLLRFMPFATRFFKLSPNSRYVRFARIEKPRVRRKSAL